MAALISEYPVSSMRTASGATVRALCNSAAPSHSRHAHVRENDRDPRVLPQDLQGRLGADRRVDTIAIFEQVLQALDDLRLVIDTQYFHRLMHG